MKKIIETIKSQIPPELRRPSSLFSLVIALIITGFFLQLGTKLFDGTYTLLEPHFPVIFRTIIHFLTYSINVRINIITAIIFVVVFLTIYRWVDKFILNKSKDIAVFKDDFGFGNRGWLLNYWGSKNPDKTCRFENSSLVFEAEENELEDERKEYGAYFDLVSGIYEHTRYEVVIQVKADKGTKMGIKLWVHDMKGRNSIKYPANFYTPGENLEDIKVGFTGTSSQAMRIHLHVKPGKGRLYVDSVQVIKKH